MVSDLDELFEMRLEKNRYPGYHEEPISFMPTYKCEINEYNKFINKKE